MRIFGWNPFRSNDVGPPTAPAPSKGKWWNSWLSDSMKRTFNVGVPDHLGQKLDRIGRGGALVPDTSGALAAVETADLGPWLALGKRELPSKDKIAELAGRQERSVVVGRASSPYAVILPPNYDPDRDPPYAIKLLSYHSDQKFEDVLATISYTEIAGADTIYVLGDSAAFAKNELPMLSDRLAIDLLTLTELGLPRDPMGFKGVIEESKGRKLHIAAPVVYSGDRWVQMLPTVSAKANYPAQRSVDRSIRIPVELQRQPQDHGTFLVPMIRSTSLGYAARLGVYLPPGYDPQRKEPYPVLLMAPGRDMRLESWTATEAGQLVSTLDRTMGQDATKMIVLVADRPAYADERKKDEAYFVNLKDEEGERRVGDFLIKDLVDYARSNLNVRPRGLHGLGISRGGNGVLSADGMNPGFFEAVSSISGALGEDRLAGPMNPTTLALGGAYDGGTSKKLIVIGKSDPHFVEENAELSIILAKHGVDHSFRVQPDPTGGTAAHNWNLWRELLAGAIAFHQEVEGKAGPHSPCGSSALGEELVEEVVRKTEEGFKGAEKTLGVLAERARELKKDAGKTRAAMKEHLAKVDRTGIEAIETEAESIVSKAREQIESHQGSFWRDEMERPLNEARDSLAKLEREVARLKADVAQTKLGFEGADLALAGCERRGRDLKTSARALASEMEQHLARVDRSAIEEISRDGADASIERAKKALKRDRGTLWNADMLKPIEAANTRVGDLVRTVAQMERQVAATKEGFARADEKLEELERVASSIVERAEHVLRDVETHLKGVTVDTKAIAKIAREGVGSAVSQARSAIARDRGSPWTEEMMAPVDRAEARVRPMEETVAAVESLTKLVRGVPASARESVLALVTKLPVLAEPLAKLFESHPTHFTKPDRITKKVFIEQLREQMDAGLIKESNAAGVSQFLTRIRERRIQWKVPGWSHSCCTMLMTIANHPGVILDLIARANEPGRRAPLHQAYEGDGADHLQLNAWLERGFDFMEGRGAPTGKIESDPRASQPLGYEKGLLIAIVCDGDKLEARNQLNWDSQLPTMYDDWKPSRFLAERHPLERGRAEPVAVRMSKLLGEEIRYNYAHNITNGKELAAALKSQHGEGLAMGNVNFTDGKQTFETHFPVFYDYDEKTNTVWVQDFGAVPPQRISLDHFHVLEGRAKPAIFYRPNEEIADFLTIDRQSASYAAGPREARV
jgi:enterochelin esterase-like enzyme